MKAWSIKYLTTAGIECVDGWYEFEEYLCLDHGHTHRFERLGRDVFLTESEAIAAAIAKRARLIASAEKKVAKLKAMRFEVTP